MFDVATELVLNAYFMLQRLAGRFIDLHNAFDTLCDIYLVPGEVREELFALTECEEVESITSYKSFLRDCRIRSFCKLTQQEIAPVADSVQTLISIKGAALCKTQQFGFDVASTEAAVRQSVLTMANRGLIVALQLLGILQCTGILFPCEPTSGIENLEKAARWNSVDGILALLRFRDCEVSRQVNINRLRTVSSGSVYAELLPRAETAYGVRANEILEEPELLRSAFGVGAVKEAVYDPQYARVIFSQVLSLRDKRAFVFSRSANETSDIAALPLILRNTQIHFDQAAITASPLQRTAEQNSIVAGLFNSDLRFHSDYRPLCLCSDSECLLSYYMKTLGEAFHDSNVATIRVSALNEYDISPTKNHILLQNCDERSSNVYFFCFTGEIQEVFLKLAKSFLQTDSRRRFSLQHPGVAIDLSSILPVVFCDRRNLSQLEKLCDCITLDAINESEKHILLKHLLCEKAEKYGLRELLIEEDAEKFLLGYSMERAEKMVDQGVRASRKDKRGAALTLTPELLKKYISKATNTESYGFDWEGDIR